MVPGINPVTLLRKATGIGPVTVKSFVNPALVVVVGAVTVFQTTPYEVRRAPPSAEMLPPDVAVVAVKADIGSVVSEGRTAATAVKLNSFP